MQTIDGWAEADRNSQRYRSIETLLSLGVAEWALFLQDPVAYLGGNSARFAPAVLGALSATIEAGSSDTVAIFTHGLPINVARAGPESHRSFRPRLRIVNPAAGWIGR